MQVDQRVPGEVGGIANRSTLQPLIPQPLRPVFSVVRPVNVLSAIENVKRRPRVSSHFPF
jgi:hypothetical protein